VSAIGTGMIAATGLLSTMYLGLTQWHPESKGQIIP